MSGTKAHIFDIWRIFTHLQIIIDLNNKTPDFITNDAVKLTSIIKYNFFRTYAKFLNSFIYILR